MKLEYPDLPSYEYENYDNFYGCVDYKGKIVLDIGSDYGSTASYFFKHKAIKVISVDGNKNYYDQLVDNFKYVPELIPIFRNIQTHEDIDSLILEYKPDVIKCDCDLCEVVMLNSPKEILRLVPEYVMETHSTAIHTDFCKLFSDMNYVVKSDGRRSGDVWTTFWLRI